MEVVDLRPLLALVISLTCAVLVFVHGRRPFWRALWSISAAALKFAVVWSMLPGVMQGTVYVYTVAEFPPGLNIGFRVDPMGMFFALVSSTLWVIATVYTIGYMKGEKSPVRFFGFFALCVSSTVGIAFANNLLTLFLFYELLTIATYPLVIHRETPEALRAGRKYLVYTLGGGALVLLGIVLTHAAAGTLDFAAGGIIGLEAGRPLITATFIALVAGFGVKAAIMPLHGWLPAAMVAPVPVSALLHAVAVVKAGAFGVMRTIYHVFGIDLMQAMDLTTWLGWLAAFTIIAASLLALAQKNLKLRLAYSTISQVSYIVLATSLLTHFAAIAAVMHMANQGFAKITMFFVAGAIQRATGKTRIDQLDGIGRQMPWTMAAFTVAALSFTGIPLFAGFVTKWFLSLGALNAGYWWFALVMITSGLLNAAYWLPIVYRAYFKDPGNGSGGAGDPPPVMLLPILVCAAYVVALGITAEIPLMPFHVAQMAANAIFGNLSGTMD